MGQHGPGTPGGYTQLGAGVCGVDSVPVAVVLLDLWLSVHDPFSNQSFSQQLNERMYVRCFQKVVPTKPPGRLITCRLLGPTPEILTQQIWAGADFCISNKFSGGVDASSLWTTLRVCKVLCRL